MKLNQTLILATLTLAAFTAGAGAQTQTASNVSPASSPAAATATSSPDSEIRSELEQLKQLVRQAMDGDGFQARIAKDDFIQIPGGGIAIE